MAETVGEDRVSWAHVQAQLDMSFDIRNRLAEKDSIPEAAQEALTVIREKLNAQSASLFMYDKDGRLARRFLVGVDANGRPIPSEWYADEVCDETSFTWRAVIRSPGSKYGAPQVSDNLTREGLSPRSRDVYTSKLGKLTSAIALPLNGMFRTFGVLEVINRLDTENTALPFSKEEVYWASVVGITVANAISNLRRRVELDMVAKIAFLTAQPSETEIKRTVVYEKIAKLMVGPDMQFRACVIRVLGSDGQLIVCGQATDGLSWETWRPDHPRPNDAVTWQVMRSNQSTWWSDIGEFRDRSANTRWLDRNRVEAYGCFPLSIGSQAVGTLSLFATYPHELSVSERRYVETVAALIGNFAESARVLDELAETSRRLEALAKAEANAAHVAADSRAGDEITRYRHQLKNDLTDALIGLDKAKSSGFKRTQAIDRLIVQFTARLTEVENELITKADPDQRAAVDLNEVVRDVTTSMGSTANGYAIGIRFVPADDLPLILVVQEELRHIVLNLVQNAIRAIQKKGERRGEIIVSTGLWSERAVKYIELRVKDNGCGIPKENENRIYQEGFSTYQQGTGLGLHTTRKSVIRYGGKISFTSTVGKGTEFIVRLPWRQLRPKNQGKK